MANKKDVTKPVTPEEAAMDHVDQPSGKRDGGIRRFFGTAKNKAVRAGKFVANHGGKAFGFGALAAGGALLAAKLCGYELVPSELIEDAIDKASDAKEDIAEAAEELTTE